MTAFPTLPADIGAMFQTAFFRTDASTRARYAHPKRRRANHTRGCDSFHAEPSRRRRAKPSHAPAWHMAVAAGFGGFCDAVGTNWLRAIKTARQLQTTPPPLWQDLRAMTASRMTQGLPLYALTSGVANLWCFTVQHVIKQRLSHDRERPPLHVNCIAGFLAGASEAVVTNPGRRVLVALSRPGPSRSARAIVAEILAYEGAAGLWRGTGVMALRNAAWCAVFFPLTHALRGTRPTPRRDLATGAFAGAVVATMCAPIDTLLSYVQTHPDVSAVAAAHTLWQQGAMRTFNGVVPNASRAALASGIGYVTTMQVLRWLEQRQECRPSRVGSAAPMRGDASRGIKKSTAMPGSK